MPEPDPAPYQLRMLLALYSSISFLFENDLSAALRVTTTRPNHSVLSDVSEYVRFL